MPCGLRSQHGAYGAFQHDSGLLGPRSQKVSLSSNGLAHSHEAKPIGKGVLLSNIGFGIHVLADKPKC
jgi:hypothetical protein